MDSAEEAESITEKLSVSMDSSFEFRKIVLPAAAMMICWGCSQSTDPYTTYGENIFFNSFESSKDTVGWEGYGSVAFVEDSPPKGGKRSVRISGGCIVPHVQIHFKGPEEDCYLTLQCWGKNLAAGGGISLQRKDGNSIHISLSASDTVWTVKKSEEYLFCPAGQELVIEMMSGGIFYSAMLIDLLEVKKADF